MVHNPFITQILLTYNFLSYSANRQTDRQTDSHASKHYLHHSVTMRVTRWSCRET